MGRGHGLDHTEKCRKYRQQIENLKMDLEELQEECNNSLNLNREERLFIYTGLEMYWKSELNRTNQEASKAKDIDKVRAKIAETLKKGMK